MSLAFSTFLSQPRYRRGRVGREVLKTGSEILLEVKAESVEGNGSNG